MMTNTVILFLRDLLPIFILLSYLLVIFDYSKVKQHQKLTLLAVGIMSTFVMFYCAEYISDWFDGAGLEIFYASLLLIFYFSLLCLYLIDTGQREYTNWIWLLTLLGTSVFIAVKGTEFLIFFSVYQQQSEHIANVLLGCILGLGICISFSVLFRFVLQELKESKYAYAVLIAWHLFLAGHFSQIVPLLSQVDIISLNVPLFNVSAYIQDSSEYGHILYALFGYESSPSISLLLFYAGAFILPTVLQFIVKHRYVNNDKQGNAL